MPLAIEIRVASSSKAVPRQPSLWATATTVEAESNKLTLLTLGTTTNPERLLYYEHELTEADPI